MQSVEIRDRTPGELASTSACFMAPLDPLGIKGAPYIDAFFPVCASLLLLLTLRLLEITETHDQHLFDASMGGEGA